MEKGIWNVVLYKVDGDRLVRSENNPKESGRYLCTCVRMWQGEEQGRYLQVMEYDANKNHWHDCGNKNGISHGILAWTDKVIPCDFKDFDYVAGGCLIEKEKDTNNEYELDR